MKLLFDQNLSHKLVRRLADLFPNSLHVRGVGLQEAEDPVVWDYAKQHEVMIVSKDEDFHQRSFVLGFPFGPPPGAEWPGVSRPIDKLT